MTTPNSSSPDRPASELAEAVESCTLAASAFRHRQHVQLGWHYLRTLPLLDAVVRFGCVVDRFASHHGATDKYDEPLTVAYMLLIEERRRLAPDADWQTFSEINADLIEAGQAILERRLAQARSSEAEGARRGDGQR